jgi:hypothetical protein
MELAMSPLKLILKKRRIWVCSQQCPQSIECLPSSQNLRVKIIKKKEKKTKKSRTLNPSLHFDSPNPKLSFLSLFFLFFPGPINKKPISWKSQYKFINIDVF